jgi:hypothetical protein
MEHESHEFKIVMDDGPDAKVLARVAHLERFNGLFNGGPAYGLRRP